MRAFSATAVAALALVPLTAATGIRVPLLPCADHTPFTPLGCFKDSNPDAFIYRSASDQNDMTVEQCLAECKGNGFRYAGLKYYGVCYCGSAFEAEKVDDSECSLHCSGNDQQLCGGTEQLNVWEDPTYSKGPEDVTAADYVALGCYDDDNPLGRALSFQLSVATETFTAETCLDACRKEGFPFAGTEFGSECWCGTNLGVANLRVDASQCNSACSGDASTNCGGPSRLNVYYASGLESVELCGYGPPSLPSASSTSSVASSTSTVVSTIVSVSSSSSAVSSLITSSVASAPPSSAAPPPSSTSQASSSSAAPPPPPSSTSQAPSSSAAPPPPPSSTSSSSAAPPPPPPPSTTKPTTTTRPTSTTPSLCTATTTTTPTCEARCGQWCAPALPDWTNKEQCLVAAKTCVLQLASCFKTAGWPGVTQCFEFAQWCGDVKEYCYSGDCNGRQCNKLSCWNKVRPEQIRPPTTTTTVYPCPTTLTTSSSRPTTTSVCPPEPTNICKQPTNDRWGYGPDRPVAGIPLPVVGCNDVREDFSRNPFKFYNEPNSRNCPSFKWNQRPNICQDACREQFDDCKETYVSGCENRNRNGRGGRNNKRDAEPETTEIERRTWGWGFNWNSRNNNNNHDNNNDDTCARSDSQREWNKPGCDRVDCWADGGNNQNNAEKRCKAQYNDCLAVNRGVTPGNACRNWCAA